MTGIDEARRLLQGLQYSGDYKLSLPLKNGTPEAVYRWLEARDVWVAANPETKLDAGATNARMSFDYSKDTTEILLEYRRQIINEKGKKREVVEALYNDLVIGLVRQEDAIMAELRSRYPRL